MGLSRKDEADLLLERIDIVRLDSLASRSRWDAEYSRRIEGCWAALWTKLARC